MAVTAEDYGMDIQILHRDIATPGAAGALAPND